MRPPHQVLGVAESADPDTIKRAYRRLAKQLHPDTAGRTPHAQSRFQEITEAYRALTARDAGTGHTAADAAKARRAYDKPTPADHQQATQNPTQEPTTDADKTAPEHTEERPKPGGRTAEFFEALKQAGTKPFRKRGDDLTCSLTLPFLDAARGGTHRVTLPTQRTVDVELPPGVEDGKQIRLRGLGASGAAGGGTGDALITVEIEPHTHFSRHGLDIHVTLPISIAEAVDGAKVQVPTIDGRVWVTIPAGANSGQTLRLTGKGLAPPEGEKGHQFITLMVMMPDTVDADLAAFVRAWPGAKSYNPRAAAGLV